MSVDVSKHSVFVPLFNNGMSVAKHSVFVPLLDADLVVSKHSVFVAMLVQSDTRRRMSLM